MSLQLPNDDESGEMSEINVTPLVDVMLVLLVVFIVTTPLLTQVVRVKLPKTEQTRTSENERLQSRRAESLHAAAFGCQITRHFARLRPGRNEGGGLPGRR